MQTRQLLITRLQDRNHTIIGLEDFTHNELQEIIYGLQQFANQVKQYNEHLQEQLKTENLFTGDKNNVKQS